MALRDISHWNGDKSNPKLIWVQDKGSCFIVDYKQKYVENHLRYIGDERTFRIDMDDLSQQNLHKVRNWVRKRERAGVLEESVCNWIVVDNPEPAKLYANVKTHKTDWPYRFIMSARGTATENLARWLEFRLKPYARMHEAYIKDTKTFLLHLEHLNQTRAPFKEGSKLIGWDIVNYYPNCSTELCLWAVKKILNDKATGLSEINKECILEALSITCLPIMDCFKKNSLLKLKEQQLGVRNRQGLRTSLVQHILMKWQGREMEV